MKRFLYPLLVASVLSGCGGDSASYMIDGDRGNAFSLFRDKSYPGADWELSVVLTHLPQCQRRHSLRRAPSRQPYKAELFQDAEGGYLLHSADTWYQASLAACTLGELKSAPASRGSLVGTWEERAEGFKFFAAKP